MKIVLCDDDLKTTEHFLSVLHDFGEHEIDVYNDPNKLISDISTKEYDLYFIDIEMPISGEIVVKTIRSYYPDALCVFLSDYPNRGFIACRVNVNSYIYKNMPANEIKQELERISALCYRNKLTFCFKTSDGNDVIVKVKNIEYFESLKRRIIVHLVDGLKLEIGRHTLSSLHEMFEFEKFLRISRSYLINCGCIQRAETNKITMKSGKSINITKSQLIMISERLIED